MRSRLAVILAALSTAAVVAGGCGSSGKSSGSASDSSSSSSSSSTAENSGSSAKVSFVEPKKGSAVAGDVTAKVKLTGFTLDPNAVGKKPEKGHGHLHFSMDDGKFDQPKYSGANGKLAVKLGVNGKYSPSVTPTITYKGLPKGKHRLEVYLANNDHSNTGVEANTSFAIK